MSAVETNRATIARWVEDLSAGVLTAAYAPVSGTPRFSVSRVDGQPISEDGQGPGAMPIVSVSYAAPLLSWRTTLDRRHTKARHAVRGWVEAFTHEYISDPERSRVIRALMEQW